MNKDKNDKGLNHLFYFIAFLYVDWKYYPDLGAIRGKR